MKKRYSLRWVDGDRTCWHAESFSCVGDARPHALAHRPEGATRFHIRAIGSDHAVEGDVMDGWQQIGDAAHRVVDQCGADIRDHQIKMQCQLNRRHEKRD